MTSRLFKEGHLNASAAAVVCPECGRLSPLPHCPKCQKHHPEPWKHEGFCDIKGCGRPAINYGSERRPKWGLFCREHSVEAGLSSVSPRELARERAKNQAPAFIAKSGELAEALGQPEILEPKMSPPIAPNPKALRRFMVRSRSRPSQEHMVELIDGIMQGLFCACEAGRTGHACHHILDVEASIFAGIREVPV